MNLKDRVATRLPCNGGIIVQNSKGEDVVIPDDGGGFAFLPNGHCILGSTESDGILKVLDIDNAKCVLNISQEGYSADVIRCLQNGNIIVGSTEKNATLRVFNPNDGTLIGTFPQYQRSVSKPHQLTECMEFVKRREMEKNCQVLRLAQRRETFFSTTPNEVIRKIVLYTGDIFNYTPQASNNSV